MRRKELTPKEIVKELDQYIVGQEKAKKAVAIALRNRWRRQRVKGDIKEDILPNNIILIGPTGVGKTEIARRLANLAHAPFIKVEASKYTEVGYVGRDVESIIRDLTNIAVNMVKEERMEEVREQAEKMANERILDILLPPRKPAPEGFGSQGDDEQYRKTREKLREMLEKGELEDRVIEITVQQTAMPVMQVFGPAGIEEMGLNLTELLENAFPRKKKAQKVTVEEARKIFAQEEAQKLIDMDAVVKEAIRRVEESGIVFIDEIDKIAVRSTEGRGGPDVSREGVQRDILPIVEGCNVQTKYGVVKTDHILFIAAGAFHMSKPSDLIPELQGRFPIRVEMDSLGKEEFIKILKHPRNALIKQYTALLETEGVKIEFDDEAIEEIAELACEVNEKLENIGARRLHTILTTLLEDILFEVPNPELKEIKVTCEFVRKKLADVVRDRDLSKYIL
ncbi:MAG: HslU--HslV peptidase ATPase subunit [Candidatus Neomarinimicrobiota bacterium]|nr:MAG: HslU--HslV peptidase ATPase subunit [Candidatus Neomarinimicrobiota bacterium]HDN59868.1 ATP-dependent protease ATPase subunit HslU [Candidatus Neomarinimicrobiota bacterium]